MPPMPKMPRIFFCGSWPRDGAGEPLKCCGERRKERMEVLKLRRAPRSRKSAVSAVLSSTAVGTLVRRMLREERAEGTKWS
jgi:hypothetical protein